MRRGVFTGAISADTSLETRDATSDVFYARSDVREENVRRKCDGEFSPARSQPTRPWKRAMREVTFLMRRETFFFRFFSILGFKNVRDFFGVELFLI